MKIIFKYIKHINHYPIFTYSFIVYNFQFSLKHRDTPRFKEHPTFWGAFFEKARSMSSSNENFVTLKEFDPEQVTLSSISKFSMGATQCQKIIILHKGRPFKLICPKLYSPFGYSQFPQVEKDAKYTPPTSETKITVQLNMLGYKNGFENMDRIKMLYDKLMDLEMRIVTEIMKDTEKYLGRFTDEASLVEEMYQKLIIRRKTAENEEYDPSIRVKLPFNYKKDGFKVAFFDENNTEITVTPKNISKQLQPRAWFKTVLNLPCIYFISGKLFTSFEAEQIQICKTAPDGAEKILKEYEEKKESKTKESKTKETKAKASKASMTKASKAVSEDEEDEEEDEEAAKEAAKKKEKKEKKAKKAKDIGTIKQFVASSF
jgi:hypothetical protein